MRGCVVIIPVPSAKELRVDAAHRPLILQHKCASCRAYVTADVYGHLFSRGEHGEELGEAAKALLADQRWLLGCSDQRALADINLGCGGDHMLAGRRAVGERLAQATLGALLRPRPAIAGGREAI
jgi:hypothetical protein